MGISKKASIYFSTSLLLFSALPPLSVNAEANKQEIENNESETVIVSAKEGSDSVNLLIEGKENSEIFTSIPNNTEVTILEAGAEYTHVTYFKEETEEHFVGYIKNELLVESKQTNENQDKESAVEETNDGTPETTDTPQLGEDDTENLEPTEETDVNEETPIKSVEENAEENVETESHAVEPSEEEVGKEKESDSPSVEKQEKQMRISLAPKASGETHYGIALRSPTNIYAQASTSSKVLKNYDQGSVLKYETLTSEWYQCVVYIDGKPTQGFIKTSDVENLVENQEDLTGIGTQSPTPVYSDASKNSTVLKSYSQGSVLKYRTFAPGWYEATVYANGHWTTGYISVDDVENTVSNQETLNGVSLGSPTPIYTKASTNSNVLKSYNKGSILKYKTFAPGWYEATIYVNGHWEKGYIKSSDVENVINNQELLKGVGVQNPTHIYSEASTSSKVLKSYGKGSVLIYKTFVSGWYEATVYVNGNRKTGYIRSSDVENSEVNQKSLKGIGLDNPTRVYSGAATNSNVLKSYNQGSVLYYRTFVSGWYEATVYVNGDRKTGYIKSSDVENIVAEQKSLEGLSLKNPTNVYAEASRSSRILKDYRQGSILKYETFTSGWYKCTVYLNGNATTGYINVNDVKNLGSDIIQHATDYGLSLSEMLDIQMGNSPQTDKYRNEPAYIYADYVDMNKQIVTDDRVNVRSSPSTANSGNIVQQLNTGDNVLVIGKSGDWVEVRITWKNAKPEDVKYYLNPSNFTLGSKAYFQFLKLSLPANLSVKEVNEKVLAGKGILAGKGQAFINAANKHKVNELYLISHALLETGNGTSTLAEGVIYNGVKVYNMYGYGAYDSCALECGAKTAYEQGWFTPEEAIIGGARLISSGYIYNSGFQQDTLYKMRWNPVEPWHQYATDIGWAYKQVDSIYNLYQLIDNYTLYYDVPTYQ
jgi:beta-N-acetylglucosaminidase